MKKNIVITIVIITIAVVLIVNSKQAKERVEFNAQNSTFSIENKSVTLINGISKMNSTGTPEVEITTKYFGNEIKHDLDNDGRQDAVFLVTQDGGGTGTFFYVVAVLNTENGYKGSDSYFLGDRIAPQSISIDEGDTTRGTKRDNVIVVNYATRKLNEPMTTSPSVGKSVWLKLDPITMQFGEVAQNFEGESR